MRTPITAAAIAALMTTGLVMAQDNTNSTQARPQDRVQNRGTEEVNEYQEGVENAQDNAREEAEMARERMQDRADRAQDRMNDRAGDDLQKRDLSPEQVKQMEQEFVNWAANANYFEIETAKLAQQHGNDQVKRLAAQLQRDHEQANQLLKRSAQSAGYDVPDSIDKDILREKLDLMKKNAQENPEEFNQAFVFGQVGAHKEAILWNAHAAENCQSQELKQYASTILPKLRGHAQQGERLAYAMIGGDTASQLRQDARTASGQLGEDHYGDQDGHEGHSGEHGDKDRMDRDKARNNPGVDSDPDTGLGIPDRGGDRDGDGSQGAGVRLENPANDGSGMDTPSNPADEQ